MKSTEKKELIKHRAQAIAHYIIYNQSTIRSAAKIFAVSVDTVSDDINKRLELINKPLYAEVRKVIDNNKRNSLCKAREIKKELKK